MFSNVYPTTETYTLRHGLSDDNINAAGTFGSRDPSLVDIGRTQAYQAGIFAARLGIGLIVSSPAIRARQTTEEFTRGLGHPVEIVYDSRAAEQYYGPWPEGTSKSAIFDTPEMIERAKAEGLRLKIHPEGESEADVAERIAELERDYQHLTPGKLLISTHGQTSKALPGVHQNVSRQVFRKCDVPNGSIALLDVNDPNLRTPIFIPSI
ncbi:MAG TPA: histidine phosphatase family protein [Candidatus Saccharimonadales bacterium]